jgi:hypothetical protein
MKAFTVLLQTYYPMTNRPKTIVHGYVLATCKESAKLEGIKAYGRSFCESYWLKLNKETTCLN